MYAIIETGGKQFRVEEGMKVQIPELEVESGAEVTFDKVLLTADGDAIRVGRPTVEGASVKGVSLGEVKGEKLLIRPVWVEDVSAAPKSNRASMSCAPKTTVFSASLTASSFSKISVTGSTSASNPSNKININF